MQKIFIYDFDGTLTPFPYPKFQIIEKCGIENSTMNPEFLKLVMNYSKEKNAGIYNSFYGVYFKLLRDNNYSLTDDNFTFGADKVIYNNGVPEFLQMLKNNDVKNYLLSSGLTTYLDKTIVAPSFEKIYATTFNYKNNEAVSIDFLMSDENKVVAIKDIMEKNNCDDCRDITYVGDGLTDLYAMEYVKNNGGNVIFVTDNLKNKDIKIIKEKNIVDLFTLRDFSKNSELSNYAKNLCNIETKKY